MSEKVKCSVGILTFNSAKTLKRALESVKDFSEIIVCDGGSADDTLNIAREYDAKIVSQFDDGIPRRVENFSEARNKCLANATHDWFLYVDSDEALSKELAEEVASIVRRDGPELVYQIPSRIIIDGQVIRYSSSYPGYQVRFFSRKTGAHFIKPVHERVLYDRDRFKVGKLKNPWYIYWDKNDVKNFSEKAENYIPIEVERNKNWTFGQYIKWGVYRNILASVKIFIKATKNYMLHGFGESMPPRVEWARVAYHLKLMWRLTRSRLVK
jgi:glycosyltransferase involved in cell wall biosynthesis